MANQTKHSAIFVGLALAVILLVGCRTTKPPELPPMPSDYPRSIPGAEAGVTSVTLAWEHPEPQTVSGFRIYNGIASRTYTNIIDAGYSYSCTVSNLPIGLTNFFAATAYNTNGMESEYSDECTYAVFSVPPITNVTVITLFSTNVSGPWSPILTNTVPITATNGFFRQHISP